MYNESINNVKLSCGSNCTAAILDDGNISFWGEFTSGILRQKNKINKIIAKDSPVKKQFSNFVSSKENSLNRMRSTLPKIMPLPQRLKLSDDNNSEYKVYNYLII